MIGCFNKSVLLTYTGIFFAIIGICFANTNLYSAMLCLLFAGICDMFDGTVARKCKRTELQKQFGRKIDSLADMFSFAALPCVLLLNMPLYKPASIVIALLYAVACITRLAWFDMTDDGGKYFTGLPVTYSALILPSCCIIAKIMNNLYFFYLFYCILAIFFVLDIKIKKPRGKMYLVILSAAAVIGVILCLFMTENLKLR